MTVETAPEDEPQTSVRVRTQNGPSSAVQAASLPEAEDTDRLSTSHRRRVTAALMLVMISAALEQTVVATAMPTIISHLHGLPLYSWVFSIYLLTSTVTMPVYGKLADLWGRKPILMGGIALFLLGSTLCGAAATMPQLILFRGIQGLGAGAMMPITLTVIGDLYTLEERARVQGLFTGIWGTASLAGPALGALLTVALSWRWVFFVNIPSGLIAGLMLARLFRERVEPRNVSFDVVGALTLSGGVVLVLLAALEGPHRGWSGVAVLGGLGVFALVCFVRHERRAPEPLLPLDLWKDPVIAGAFAGSFLIGTIIFGVDTFVPLFVQGVRVGSVINAGAVVTPVMLLWATSGTLAPLAIVRFGLRGVALAGACLILLGMGLLLVVARHAGTAWLLTLSMALTGAGLGQASTVYILGVQHAVPWERRGIATGAVQFFRTIGGALGVGLLGALLALTFQDWIHAADLQAPDVSSLLTPEGRKHIDPGILRTVRGGLAVALDRVFFAMFALAVAGTVCAWWMRDEHAADQDDRGEELAGSSVEL